MKQFLCALSISCLAVTANASILVNSVNFTTAGQAPGETLWSYTFALQPDQNMRQTCTGTCPYANDFATIIDFLGYQAGSANLTGVIGGGYGFTITEELTTSGPTLFDAAGISNIRVSLTGGGTIDGSANGGSPTTLFTLNLISTNPGSSLNVVGLSAQAYNSTTTTTAFNQGTTAGPSVLAPEPATFALSGLGMIAFAIARRKRA